jgi:hypothetical protein
LLFPTTLYTQVLTFGNILTEAVYFLLWRESTNMVPAKPRETKLPFLKFPVCLKRPTSMQLLCARPLTVFVAQTFDHQIGMFSQAHIYFLQPQRIWYSVHLIRHHVKSLAPAQFHR